MPSKTPTIEQLRIRLAETPVRLAALTKGLTPAQLHTPPGPEAWSANDVLAHLRACADVWGDHVLAILAEDKPTRQGVNPRTWINKTNYPNLKFQPSLRSFIKQRADLLAVLNAVPDAAWSRTATVMAWNMPYEPTALSFAERLTRHERTHIKQIEQIVRQGA